MALASLLSAGLVVVVFMLYNTVVNIIRIVGLGETDHHLTVNEEEVTDQEQEKTEE